MAVLGHHTAAACMFMDVDLQSRELIVFSFRFWQQMRDRLHFLFEVHRQVVLYKDAESKVTKKIYDFWGRYDLWRDISRVYTRRWLFSPARQARLVPASAGDYPNVPSPVFPICPTSLSHYCHSWERGHHSFGQETSCLHFACAHGAVASAWYANLGLLYSPVPGFKVVASRGDCIYMYAHPKWS